MSTPINTKSSGHRISRRIGCDADQRNRTRHDQAAEAADRRYTTSRLLLPMLTAAVSQHAPPKVLHGFSRVVASIGCWMVYRRMRATLRRPGIC
jgi:hypothetical protein